MSHSSSAGSPDASDVGDVRARLVEGDIEALRHEVTKLSLDSLIAWCEEFWATCGVAQIVRDISLAQFDAIANGARAAGQHDIALRAFKAKLTFSYHDQNVRCAVAEYLWQENNTAGVLDILRPTIDLPQPPGAFEMYVRAALAEGSHQDISRYGQRLIYDNPTDKAINERIRQVSTLIAAQTVDRIAQTGEITDDLRNTSKLTALIDIAGQLGITHITNLLIQALQTIDDMIPVADCLLRLRMSHVAIAKSPDSIPPEDVQALVDSAIRTNLLWTASTVFGEYADKRIAEQMRALGEINECVDIALHATNAVALVWACRNCIGKIQQSRCDKSLIVTLGNTGRVVDKLSLRRDAIKTVFPAACVELIQQLSDSFADSGDASHKCRSSVSGDKESAGGRGKTRIFYMITWHADPSSLVRLCSAIYDEDNFYLVIVGGTNSRQQVDSLLWLMAKPNIMLMNGAPTAWGGRTLLFENVFLGLTLFRLMPVRYHWVQVLCNKSFPLVTQDDMRSQLEDISRHEQLQTLPPPAYEQSFYTTPDGEFASLNHFKHNVFSRADLRFAAVEEMGRGDLVAHAYNFSGDWKPLEVGFKTREQSYGVKGVDVDIKNMSWGRFIEMVDTAEDGRITTSMLAPFHQTVIHRALKRWKIHTGDPFVMMSAAFVDYIFTNQRAADIYLAMAHQFAPEMNYFDTVLMNSPHKAEPSHLYYRGRRADLIVEEGDIDGALVSPKFFIRKIDRPDGIDFANYFGQRLHDRLPESERIWVAEVRDIRALPRTRDPEQIAAWLDGTWTLRDLNHRHLAKVTAHQDGKLIDEQKNQIGMWESSNGGIKVFMHGDSNSPIEYRRATVADGQVIRIPEQIVWIGSDWGRFWCQPLLEGFLADQADTTGALSLSEVSQYYAEGGVVMSSRNQVGPLFSSFSNVQDDPMVAGIDRIYCTISGVGRDTDGRLIAQVNSRSGSLALEIIEVLFTGDRAVLTMRRTDQTVRSMSTATNVVIQFTKSDAIGRWRLVSRLSPGGVDVVLRDDNRTSDGTAPAGFWKLIDGKIVIVDHNPWPIIELPQQAWTPTGWRVAGYGQYDLSQDDYISGRKIGSETI